MNYAKCLNPNAGYLHCKPKNELLIYFNTLQVYIQTKKVLYFRVRAASDTPVKDKRKSTNSILKTSLLASQAPWQPDQSPMKALRGRAKNKVLILF